MEMNPLEGLLGPKPMDPTVMGLLSAAAAGMQASGPSRTPTSIGQTFGAALGAGMPAYMQTQQFNAQRQMQGLQTAKMLDDMAQTGQQRNAIRDYAMSLPETERAQFLANPQGYLAAKAKAMEPFTMKPGDRRYAGGQEVASAPAAPQMVQTKDEAGNPIQRYEVPTPGQSFPVYQAPQLKDLPVAGQPGVTRPTWLTPGQALPSGTGLKMPEILNTDVFNRQRQLREAGRPNVNVSVDNAGPKAFETAIAKVDADQLDAMRKSAMTANDSLNTVRNLRTAIQEGAYSGGLANGKTAVANLINGITGATPSGLVGSQKYNAEASKLVLDHVKALGANPSNADREFIEKTVPQLSMSPKAREALINFIEEKATKTIDLYKRADTYGRSNRSLSGFDFFNGSNIQNEADAIIRGGNGNR